MSQIIKGIGPSKSHGVRRGKHIGGYEHKSGRKLKSGNLRYRVSFQPVFLKKKLFCYFTVVAISKTICYIRGFALSSGVWQKNAGGGTRGRRRRRKRSAAAANLTEEEDDMEYVHCTFQLALLHN